MDSCYFYLYLSRAVFCSEERMERDLEIEYRPGRLWSLCDEKQALRLLWLGSHK